MVDCKLRNTMSGFQDRVVDTSNGNYTAQYWQNYSKFYLFNEMKHKVPNAFYRGKKSKFQTILPWDKNLG
jgi:hypothetical protein